MSDINTPISENQNQSLQPPSPLIESNEAHVVVVPPESRIDQTESDTQGAAVDDTIWQELETYGVSTVEVTGSGSGDSGQVDDVICNPAIELPKELVNALEDVAQEIWSKHFGEYCDGDGAQVEATFNVPQRQLTVRVGYYSTNLDWRDSVIVA